MNELEMSLMLNLITEPEKNIIKDSSLCDQLSTLHLTFIVSKQQVREIGRFDEMWWSRLVPWWSLN